MVRDVHSLIMGEFHSGPFFPPNYSKLLPQDPFFPRPDQLSGIPFPSPQTLPESSASSAAHDDAEIFSDIALNYINSMLNEEEDDKLDGLGFQDYSPALEAAEKPFYEILGKKYPPSPVYPAARPESTNSASNSPDSISPNYGGGSSSGNNSVNWANSAEFATQSSFGSGSNSDSFDGFDPNQLLESLPAWQFQRGVEEARKFLPSSDKLFIDLETTQGFGLGFGSTKSEVKTEKDDLSSLSSYSSASRGRKNPHSDDSGLELEERRSVKQTAFSSESPLRSTEFDEVLLCYSGGVFPKAISDIRDALQHVVNSQSSSGSHGHGKGRNRRQQGKKEVVDLRSLLINCAQMVAADDRRTTAELLKQIRQNSSPTGDGSQRLAHYFANGIEARLAGNGMEIYNSLKMQRRTATDFLKAYQLFMAICPFKKISYFFSNQTILNASEKASRVHVVDLGINFGFQWPSLLQRLSSRPGGPPMLRITGINLPQPGFRPAERIEETGRRLAEYARDFKVPFEYKAIASKFEEVRIEDLDIREGEVLIVNCLYQLKYLADETVVVDSPRNTVLHTIRKMNPTVFIHAVVNGSYSAPFFVTRFREALFHYSAMFDMLETLVPREEVQRLLIEREIFGREAMNVIACEGLERVERPETYKQWQVRNLRAGFVQNPVCRDIMKKARDKVKDFYHKDFCVDEDSRWLLQGWKGRIVMALSSWKPHNDS